MRLGVSLTYRSYSLMQACLPPVNMYGLKGLPQHPGLPMSTYSVDDCQPLAMSWRFTTTGSHASFSIADLLMPVSLTRSLI